MNQFLFTAKFKRHGTADNIRDSLENICKDSEKSSTFFIGKKIVPLY